MKKLKRKIIEAIHNLPYDEAIIYELMAELKTNSRLTIKDVIDQNGGDINNIECMPITLGRVIYAIKDKIKDITYHDNHASILCYGDKEFWWKLTKEHKAECTIEDQKKEEIEILKELL